MTHVRVLDFSFGFVWLERWKMVGGKIGRIKNILVFSDIYLVEMMEKYKNIKLICLLKRKVRRLKMLFKFTLVSFLCNFIKIRFCNHEIPKILIIMN